MAREHKLVRNDKKQPAKAPAASVEAQVDRIASLSIDDLRSEWRKTIGKVPPAGLTKDLMARALTYHLQEQAFGGLSAATRRVLRDLGKTNEEPRRHVKAGSIIVREYEGVLHEVMVVQGGFCWQGQTFDSLSTIAKRITGTNWNGPRFFGLRGKLGKEETPDRSAKADAVPKSRRGRRPAFGGRSPPASPSQLGSVPSAEQRR